MTLEKITVEKLGIIMKEAKTTGMLLKHHTMIPNSVKLTPGTYYNDSEETFAKKIPSRMSLHNASSYTFLFVRN